eukprot:2746587-Pleurochrysis_carterae.AAC.2
MFVSSIYSVSDTKPRRTHRADAQHARSTTAVAVHRTGVSHKTFQSACQRRGLLQDDAEWHAVLPDAVICSNSSAAIWQLPLPVHHPIQDSS